MRVFVADAGRPPVWYCGFECLAYDLALRPALTAQPFIWARNPRKGLTVAEAIGLLNRYSGYTLTPLGLTRPRIAYAHRAALARLVPEHPMFDDVRAALAAARGLLLEQVPEPAPAPAETELAELDVAIGY